jgi:hypothetical protein
LTEYCAIIPDRGDRPEFTEHCLERLRLISQKLPFDLGIVHVDYPPFNAQFDLIERIKTGIKQAKHNGFKKAFIVENDDWYSEDYFKPFEEDFVGYSDTIYYHIKNKTWEHTFHPNHASLFSTAFKLSAMATFKWPRPDTVFLDIGIWKHAQQTGKCLLKKDNPNIGIKHGIGLCGGMGHRQTFPFKDYKMEWLAAKVDEKSLELYKELGERTFDVHNLVRK